MVRNTGSAERHRNELRLIHDPVAGVRFDFLGVPLTILAAGCSNSSVRSVAAGLQWGLRFLSLMMLTLGVLFDYGEGLRAFKQSRHNAQIGGLLQSGCEVMTACRTLRRNTQSISCISRPAQDATDCRCLRAAASCAAVAVSAADPRPLLRRFLPRERARAALHVAAEFAFRDRMNRIYRICTIAAEPQPNRNLGLPQRASQGRWHTVTIWQTVNPRSFRPK